MLQNILKRICASGYFTTVFVRSMAVPASSICSPGAHKNPKLKAIPDVVIERSGKFKYILIKVHDPAKEREFKHIVRGTSKAGFHGDIFDEIAPEIEESGLDCECVGGGRIQHDSGKKKIEIFGYSQGFGQADHRITASLKVVVLAKPVDTDEMPHASGSSLFAQVFIMETALFIMEAALTIQDEPIMMSIASVSVNHWDRISSYVNHAAVFIDVGSAEVLHWHGGLMRLVNAGATDVREFSSFESAKEAQKKGVFILSSLLEGVTRNILHDIIQASQFQYVVVITTASAGLHNFSRTGSSEDDRVFFEQVEERLLEWMGNMNYTAEVFHIPCNTISLGNSVFLMPSYSRLFPLISSDLHQVELLYNTRAGKTDQRDFASLKEIDTNSLPKELQLLYKQFISSIDSLLFNMAVREDIYYLGNTSRLLATELDTLPSARNRRKASQNRASIVFIDRTLDLATAVSHNTDTLFDKIQQVLPRLPGHKTDVKVNMSPLCKVHGSRGSEVIASGCLATSSPTGSQQGHLSSLLASKQKEALMDVNRQLVEAASVCNLPLSLKGKATKITADQLQSTLDLFRGQYKNISSHLDSIQLAMATAETLRSPRMHHYDEMISLEKGLIQSLSDPDALSVLSQLLHIVWKKDSKEYKYVYSLDDVLCLLVYVYSVAGQALLEQEDEESQLQRAFLDRIMEERDCLPDLIKSVVGEGVRERAVVSDILDDMWEKLLAVATVREDLQHFRSVVDFGSALSPASQNSLLKQVVSAILDPQKPELVDIKMISSGVKDMLKSGFGLFRSVAKPRPCDHPLMMLFIVGGITTSEVKQIRDTVNLYKPDTQVVVGSTHLLTPAETVQSVLCQNNVNQDDSSH